jgi:hypothetical protein
MSGNVYFIRFKIKAFITFINRGITNEYIGCRSRRQFMRRVMSCIWVTTTTKYSKELIVWLLLKKLLKRCVKALKDRVEEGSRFIIKVTLSNISVQY